TCTHLTPRRERRSKDERHVPLLEVQFCTDFSCDSRCCLVLPSMRNHPCALGLSRVA
uniref:Uncharacterized protein n=1 Tax=Solanum lycopersicum TaxID=4081 RepID=A0A3Q7GWE8_SOLLC